MDNKLKEMLINNDYKDGNDCYFKQVGYNIFYFNHDEDDFTTITVKNKRYGFEELLSEYTGIEYLEELERIGYGYNFDKKIIKEFIRDFTSGVEDDLFERDKTTLYVDKELVNYLDIMLGLAYIDINTEIIDVILDEVMEAIVNKLNEKGYIEAYISSSNEITAIKKEQDIV